MVEQRKLIKLGNSSFAIALPKEWVEKAGLKKGDNIFIERNSGGELIVTPTIKKLNGDREVELSLEGKGEEEIARDIISAYVGGYKSINIIGNKNKIKIAKQKAKNFLNLELIEEKEGRATFRDLLDLENIEIKNFIRRMDNNLKDMFTIVLETLRGNRKINPAVKELESIDKDVTKFYFLIWRFMNIGIDNPGVQANLKINPKSFLSFFWISYNMEQVGDELKRTARKLDNIQKEKENLITLLKIINENYNSSMKAFFRKDKNLARDIILKKGETNKLCEKLAKTKGCEAICEKLLSISASIHSNSKMVFYEL